MCSCKNIEVGSYANQVLLKAPDFMLPLRNCLGEIKNTEYIAVDRCLKAEIESLWLNGISTTGCCCGHNKIAPYIGVAFKDIDKMLSMGYEVRFNEMRPNDKDSFKPKTI